MFVSESKSIQMIKLAEDPTKNNLTAVMGLELITGVAEMFGSSYTLTAKLGQRRRFSNSLTNTFQ